MVEKVLSEFQLLADSKVTKVKEKQLKNFPEIYWVAIPLKIENRDIKINDFSEFFYQDEIKKW